MKTIEQVEAAISATNLCPAHVGQIQERCPACEVAGLRVEVRHAYREGRANADCHGNTDRNYANSRARRVSEGEAV